MFVLKYLIDFKVLALLYIFVFFQKMESNRQGYIACEYADVCVSVLCSVLYTYAGYNISAIYSESSV